MAKVSGEPGREEGEPEVVDLCEGELELTGFNTQRLTCLFKLEATPKRRPQVSQTKAARIW